MRAIENKIHASVPSYELSALLHPRSIVEKISTGVEIRGISFHEQFEIEKEMDRDRDIEREREREKPRHFPWLVGQ